MNILPLRIHHNTKDTSKRLSTSHIWATSYQDPILWAFPSGVSNAKYLAFDIPNTKKPLSLDVLNAKIFGIDE